MLCSLVCALAYVLGVGAAVAENIEQAPEKVSKTLRKRIVVKQGDDEEGVPNGAFGSHDPTMIDTIRERWEHLESTINRSYPFHPGNVEISPSEIRPWAPPTDTRPVGGGDALKIEINSTPSSVVPDGFSAAVNEPSVAAVGDYVFYTANWFAAASTDGGATWTYVNPFEGPFSDPAGENFCCNQQVQHDGVSNTIFWLQQMIPAAEGGGGAQRVNVDQTSDGTWDCYYDLTPLDADFGEDAYPDSPDFSVSDEHLFVTSNVFGAGDGEFQGAFIARIPLAEISTCRNAMVDFHTETGFGSFRSTQGAGETMFFGALDSAASIRVWSWPEAASAPVAVVRPVQAFLFGKHECADPSNTNWCASHDTRLMAAAVAGDRVAFLWVPEENPAGGFPFPYTQGVILDASNGMAVLEEPLVWSNDAAWVYPSLAANAAGGFGGTVLWGGGSFFPRCSAFLVDGLNGHTWAPLEHEMAVSGTGHAGGDRSGDYLSTRAHSSIEGAYAGSCFAYPEDGVAESRYVLFGRAGDLVGGQLFLDGFESGGVGSWSKSFP